MQISVRQAAVLTVVFAVQVSCSPLPPTKAGITASVGTNPIYEIAGRIKEKLKAAKLLDEAAFPSFEKELDLALQDTDLDGTMFQISVERVFGLLKEDGVLGASTTETGTGSDVTQSGPGHELVAREEGYKDPFQFCTIL
ncbi:hypothetical protein AB5N19_03852 [Seiridium cardinale]|uniref:Uncharacterized protein n=1 Tax=Seiridium cardinale TaxID=138064 RepID=A0ABR2Y3H9_9PEZI